MCSQEERLEKLDGNYYQLREDFDQAMPSTKQEISDHKKICAIKSKFRLLKEQCAELKASFSESDAKICSLESEIAIL